MSRCEVSGDYPTDQFLAEIRDRPSVPIPGGKNGGYVGVVPLLDKERDRLVKLARAGTGEKP